MASLQTFNESSNFRNEVTRNVVYGVGIFNTALLAHSKTTPRNTRSLRSLLRLRQEEPRNSHANKQPNTNWMQDKRSNVLSQHARHERRECAPGTAHRANERQRRDLHFPRDESLEDVYSTRITGP